MTGLVIAGVDGSAQAHAAANYAARFADRNGSALELLHAFTWPVIYPPLIPDADTPDVLPRERARALLAETERTLRERYPRLAIKASMSDGSAGGVLIEASRRASYLVVGHRGLGGFKELLVGSVALQATSHALCPVIVVRGDPPAADAPIIAGVDGSPGARAAARLAFVEAKARGVDLVVAVAWPPSRVWPKAEKAAGLPPHAAEVDPVAVSLARIVEDFPDVKVHTEVRHSGVPPQMLTALATEIGAGLIVVGCRGMGGFRGLVMGSTSRALVDHATCPVMVVPKGVART